MNEVDQPTTNFERLFAHLKKGSLAAKLVGTQVDPDNQEPSEALNKVILDRLDQVRREYDQPSN